MEKPPDHFRDLRAQVVDGDETLDPGVLAEGLKGIKGGAREVGVALL